MTSHAKLLPTKLRGMVKKLSALDLAELAQAVVYSIGNRGSAMDMQLVKNAVMKMPKSRVVAMRGERMTEDMRSAWMLTM